MDEDLEILKKKKRISTIDPQMEMEEKLRNIKEEEKDFRPSICTGDFVDKVDNVKILPDELLSLSIWVETTHSSPLS